MSSSKNLVVRQTTWSFVLLMMIVLQLPHFSSSSSWCFESDFDFELKEGLERLESEERSAKRFPAIFIYSLNHSSVRSLPSSFDVLGQWECMYLSEIIFLKSLMESDHVTSKPSEADLFYAPLTATWHAHHRQERLYASIVESFQDTFDHLKHTYPYINVSRGIDHVWFVAQDSGGLLVPPDLRNGIILQHFGDLRLQSSDEYNKIRILQENRSHDLSDVVVENAKHPCVRPLQDIVVPAFVGRSFFGDLRSIWHILGMPVDANTDSPERNNFFGRKNLAYFRGAVTSTDETYSQGIRQWLHVHSESMRGFVVLEGYSPYYYEEMKNSAFCLHPPGWASWSPRLFQILFAGCIPVIFGTHTVLPFEEEIDYSKIAVILPSIDKESLEKYLPNVLLTMSPSVVESKRQEIERIRHLFVWPINNWPSAASAETMETHVTPIDVLMSSRQGNAFLMIMRALRRRVLTFPKRMRRYSQQRTLIYSSTLDEDGTNDRTRKGVRIHPSKLSEFGLSSGESAYYDFDSVVDFSRACVEVDAFVKFHYSEQVFHVESLNTWREVEQCAAIDTCKQRTCVLRQKECNRWFRHLWSEQKINVVESSTKGLRLLGRRRDGYEDEVCKDNRDENASSEQTKVSTVRRVGICLTGQWSRVEWDSKKKHMLKQLKSLGVSVDLVLALYENTHNYAYTTHPFASNDATNRPTIRNVADIQREFEGYVDNVKIVHPLEHPESPQIVDAHLRYASHLGLGNATWMTKTHVRIWYLLHKCYDVLRDTERLGDGEDYDVVIRMREDMYLLRPINFPHIFSLLRTDTIVVPDYAEYDGINDKVAIIHRSAMQRYLSGPLERYYLFPGRIWDTHERSVGLGNDEVIVQEIYTQLGIRFERCSPMTLAGWPSVRMPDGSFCVRKPSFDQLDACWYELALRSEGIGVCERIWLSSSM